MNLIEIDPVTRSSNFFMVRVGSNTFRVFTRYGNVVLLIRSGDDPGDTAITPFAVGPRYVARLIEVEGALFIADPNEHPDYTRTFPDIGEEAYTWLCAQDRNATGPLVAPSPKPAPDGPRWKTTKHYSRDLARHALGGRVVKMGRYPWDALATSLSDIATASELPQQLPALLTAAKAWLDAPCNKRSRKGLQEGIEGLQELLASKAPASLRPFALVCALNSLARARIMSTRKDPGPDEFCRILVAVFDALARAEAAAYIQPKIFFGRSG